MMPAPLERMATRRPTEAALLWVGMQGSLLCFVLLDQFVDPLEGALIAHLGCYPLVVFDLLVDLDALLAHSKFRIRALSSFQYDAPMRNLFIYLNRCVSRSAPPQNRRWDP